jgi:parafibromin
MSSTDARASAGGLAKPVQPMIITRPSKVDPKRPVKFEIVDKAPSMNSERWERVVAVICQGKKWQFRGYPFRV